MNKDTYESPKNMEISLNRNFIFFLQFSPHLLGTNRLSVKLRHHTWHNPDEKKIQTDQRNTLISTFRHIVQEKRVADPPNDTVVGHHHSPRVEK